MADFVGIMADNGGKWRILSSECPSKWLFSLPSVTSVVKNLWRIMADFVERIPL